MFLAVNLLDSRETIANSAVITAEDGDMASVPNDHIALETDFASKVGANTKHMVSSTSKIGSVGM